MENVIIINGVCYYLQLIDSSCNDVSTCKPCALYDFCHEIIEGPCLCQLFGDNEGKVFVKC